VATVRIPSLLRTLCGGIDVLDAEGATVADVFDALESRCPGIRARLLDGDRVRRGIAVWVDGDEADPASAVRSDSEVQILPAIAGG
jgi:molybdopterin converting factor small subunit